jgi:RNA polymerase sigma-70 factor, ECF subfamily
MPVQPDQNREPVDADLTASLYAELKTMAVARLRSERANHTLQPTALVHEVCLRLLRAEAPWEDRQHLIRTAAHCMRHLLVDYARTKAAVKRGEGQPIICLDDAPTPVFPRFQALNLEDIIDVDRALTKLHSFDERQALVVELRFFGGLNEDEIALILGISPRTVKRDWESARAWLRGQLKPQPPVNRLEG